MRYVFRFGFAFALGLALMAGCSEENGEGGSGGTGAVGGGGSGGTGAVGGGGSGGMPECQGPEDCDDGEECTMDECVDGMCIHTPDYFMACADEAGICIDGSCALESCDGIEDGTFCVINWYYSPQTGVCIDGLCRQPECEIDADCSDFKDCTTQACDTFGFCTEATPIEDGSACAGGTCESGVCILQGTVLPCTEQGIRNAVAAGSGPYTFDCNVPTTVVTQAQILVDNDVILDGEGTLTVDGNLQHPVFFVRGVTAEIRDMTVTGGRTGFSGAIESHLGTVTLIRCAVSGSGGMGIYSDTSSLTLIDTTVFGNARSGIVNGGPMLLVNSTIFGNNSLLGIGPGGGILQGNVSTGYEATLINSTVSGNAACTGGGIYISNGAGPLTLINSTVSGNTSCAEGGADVQSDGGTLILQSSLIDGDCDASSSLDIVSNGHNIESPGNTCGFDTNLGDQVSVTAEQLNLGPLQDNGGPTMTHALGAGSVAIDQIPGADCVDADGEQLTTDQRGEPRPETGGTLCDVGAFELQP